MKLRLLAASLLLSLAGVAKADTLPFVLTSITYQNSFTGILELGSIDFAGECTSCVGGTGTTSTAIVDGANVTLANVAWSVSGASAAFDISFNGAVTILETGVALVKSGLTCNNIIGGACLLSSINSGLAFAVDLTGQGGTGAACANCAVNVTLSGTNIGDTLTVTIQKALSESAFGQQLFQRYNLNYTLVPVPGAVWLFLSAIGGLAAFRRRALASA
jgi:hypothetical protein